MPTTRTGRRPSTTDAVLAVGHLLWTTVVVVGAPFLLARVFGWPLPAQPPDWSEVTSTPLQLIDPTVILNAFVCAAWVCWFVVAVYVVVDLVDAARGVSQRIHRIGPFGVVAGKLVGSLVLLVSLARPAPAMAAPLPPALVAYEIDLPAAPAPAASPGVHAAVPVAPSNSAPTNPTYVVQRGDSLWAIAETHLGSGFRWTEIHDLNRDLIADPDLICTGWHLAMPADAFGLPAAVGSTTAVPLLAPPSTPAEAEVEGTPSVDAPAAIEVDPASPPAAAAPSRMDSAGGTDAERTSPSAPDPLPATTSTASPSVAASSESEAIDALLPALAPALPGITGATVLATGLLLALRHRQRRLGGSRRRGGVSDAERSLVAAADVPLVRWVGQELSLLGEQLAGRYFDATPVAVEFSEDSGIEVLWDRPVPDAPPPWEAVPGGWAWRTLYDPEAPIPAADLPSVMAGLVTIGERDGRQLLVNLEAFGSLAVTGDPQQVEGLLRSIAVEIGSGDEIGDADASITPGLLDEDTVQHLPRVEIADPESAVTQVRAASAATADLLDASGVATTFAYRMTERPLLPLEVTVTIASAAETDDHHALVLASPPHRAVATVFPTHDANAGATITIEPDGRALLEPLGATFVAAGMPPSTVTTVGDLLADAADPVAISWDPAATDDVTSDEDDGEAECPGRPDADDEPASTSAPVARKESVIDLRERPTAAEPEVAPRIPEPRMLIKVLGQPRIVNGPTLGRRELALVVYVACAKRPVRHDHIQDAIWGGDAISRKRVFNLIGATRTALGDWDGEPILTRAMRPESTITLQDGVMTDLELLRQLVAAAEGAPDTAALPLLQRGLDLVEGPPFDADGYDWAHTSNLVNEAEDLIERAAYLTGKTTPPPANSGR